MKITYGVVKVDRPETSAPAPDKITLCDPCAEHHAEHCDSPYTCRDIERVLANWKAEAERLRSALELIRSTFARDLSQGYVTRDKQFAIEIAENALQNVAELRRTGGPQK